jgi:polyisoprenoid-binding protein YceI
MTSSEKVMTPTQTPATGRYVLDPERTTIRFRTRHMFGLVPVQGHFKLGRATVKIADPAEGSSVEALVASASFSTRNPLRDVQVRSLFFLDAKRYPTMSFQSDSIEWRDGAWHVTGQLLVKRHSAPVDITLDQITTSGTALKLQAHGEIDRYAHGVTAMKGMAAKILTFVITAEGTQL